MNLAFDEIHLPAAGIVAAALNSGDEWIGEVRREYGGVGHGAMVSECYSAREVYIVGRLKCGAETNAKFYVGGN